MKKLVKLYIALILTFICPAYADAVPTYKGFVIGFTGLNETFDQQAFFDFASKRQLIPITLSWKQEDVALSIIAGSKGYYELYGFSRGASTAYSVVSKRRGRKPGCVTTIGAYHSTNVDFTKFKIPFVNYFDESGRGQRSPGIYIKNVGHLSIQSHVNNIYNECKNK